MASEEQSTGEFDPESLPDLLRRMKALQCRALESRSRHFRQQLGPAFDSLSENPDRVEAYLDDPSENIRSAAVSFLGCYCDPTQQVVETLKAKAIGDPSPPVRASAIAALGKWKDILSSKLTVRFLVEIALNKAEIPRNRESAYMALFDDDRRLVYEPKRENFDPDQDLDPIFLSSLLGRVDDI